MFGILVYLFNMLVVMLGAMSALALVMTVEA